MIRLKDKLINVIIFTLNKIGDSAVLSCCYGFADENEVPDELLYIFVKKTYFYMFFLFYLAFYGFFDDIIKKMRKRGIEMCGIFIHFINRLYYSWFVVF
jgi:cyclic lactone autoinducer peptide